MAIRFTKSRGVPRRMNGFRGYGLIRPTAHDFVAQPEPTPDTDHHNDPIVEQYKTDSAQPQPASSAVPAATPDVSVFPSGLMENRETIQQGRGALTLLVGAPFLTYLAFNKGIPGWARALSGVGVVWVLFGEGGLLATAKE